LNPFKNIIFKVISAFLKAEFSEMIDIQYEWYDITNE
jgi:hypothetical protein